MEGSVDTEIGWLSHLRGPSPCGTFHAGKEALWVHRAILLSAGETVDFCAIKEADSGTRTACDGASLQADVEIERGRPGGEDSAIAPGGSIVVIEVGLLGHGTGWNFQWRRKGLPSEGGQRTGSALECRERRSEAYGSFAACVGMEV